MDETYNFACPAASLGWVLEGSVHSSVKGTSTSYIDSLVSFHLTCALARELWTYAPQDPSPRHFPVLLF